MKRSKQSCGFFCRPTVLVTMMSLFCLASTCAQAAIWDGDTSQYWADVGNWDVAPVNGNNLTFSGTGNQSNTNNAGITSIGTLTLSTGGWDIKLGGSSVTITTINATGSSKLTGNIIMTDGTPRTVALSGTSVTLTLDGKLTLARTNTETLDVNGTGNTLELGSLDIGGNYTRAINAIANVIVNGAMTGGNSGRIVTKSGAGTLTFKGINTYLSATTISAGTLALGASGSINKSASITIAAGATFDVSAQSAYTLSTNLTASGAATAATIKGASGGTVSLGGRTVKLNWLGAALGVVSDKPPLTVTQATLVLNNDPLIVNVPGTALGEGVYTLINAPDGISGTVNPTPVYSGNGKDPTLDPSVKDTISISGNSVILTITVPPRGTMISLH